MPSSERLDLVYSSPATGEGALAAAVTCASRLAAHIAVEEATLRMQQQEHTGEHEARRMAEAGPDSRPLFSST